jgi:hypothetical protein
MVLRNAETGEALAGRNEEKKALILGEIRLPELNPGDYRLIFTAQDPVSRVSSRRKIDFSMKEILWITNFLLSR